MSIAEFDDIRPYEDTEIAGVLDELSRDAEFRSVVESVFPGVPFRALLERSKSCRTILEFQRLFPYQFLASLIEKQTTGCDFGAAKLEKTGNYTYISNHRDIVLDSAILSKMLVDSGFGNTVQIAIGDNLLKRDWIRKFVRLNKAFIVRRGVSGREQLAASMELGRYIHYAVEQRGESIWIAQRQGRAKDSNDRTQDAMLKMLAMGGEGSVVERLRSLHIVPVSISYEWDPCDFLKAREFWNRHCDPDYRKSAEEDVISMQTGIRGFKGRVHYEATEVLDSWLSELPEGIVRNDMFRIIADRIDRQIHSAYRLYPGNYAAYDLLNDTERLADHYSTAERESFESYIEERVAMARVGDADPEFLRTALLSMYANPLINHFAAIGKDF